MKKISIVSGCYNEEKNIPVLYSRVLEAIKDLEYSFEFVFIDNHSEDDTAGELEKLAALDKRVKVIINSRNFGHIRSPYHALINAEGDAVIAMCSDLQDPPEMLPELIRKWEEGYKIVTAVKTRSKENKLMYFIRTTYYRFLRSISEAESIDNFTGFGLYDKSIIEILRALKEPYPYFRGLICEIGFDRATVEFTQPKRSQGVTKNNFYTLYDVAMLGIVSSSKVPLRVATMFGFLMGGISIIIATVYFVLKLVYWDTFNAGMAPILIGIFFFSGVQLFFLGIIGEYLSVLMARVADRPHVFEQRRINFEDSGTEE